MDREEAIEQEREEKRASFMLIMAYTARDIHKFFINNSQMLCSICLGCAILPFGYFCISDTYFDKMR